MSHGSDGPKVQVNPVAVRLVGLVSVVVGSLVPSVFDGEVAERVGLCLWWFGALAILDAAVLRRDGLPAQILWGLGVWIGTSVVFFTDFPRTFYGESWNVVVAGSTTVFAMLVLASGTSTAGRDHSLATLAEEVAAAARPERPEDPAAEIARIQGVMADGIERFRKRRPREAAELDALLRRYRSAHGTDTVDTSARPTSLRNAASTLVEDMEAVRDRLMRGAGPAESAVVVAYARLMEDLVLDRTR